MDQRCAPANKKAQRIARPVRALVDEGSRRVEAEAALNVGAACSLSESPVSSRRSTLRS